jgi:hypothetical protein
MFNSGLIAVAAAMAGLPPTSGAPRKAPPPPTTPPARRYKIADSEFDEAIRDAIQDSIFSPVTLGEKHTVSLKPKFDTACWAYLPPHRIYIGTDLFEKRMVKPGLTKVQQAKYIANHYHHELGHALFTERNMKGIQAALKAMDCQFSLYNLFEDAYMEDRYRREAEYRFEWLLLEDLDFSPRPESLLFALIQAEGDVKVVETRLRTWTPEAPAVPEGDPMALLASMFSPKPEDSREKLEALLPRVVNYYRRICAVTQSMQLMPILKEWLDEFGRPPPMPQSGMSDLEQSAELMTSPQAAEEFEQDVKEVKDGPANGEKDGGGKGKAEAQPDDKAIAKKGDLLAPSGVRLDVTRAEALVAKFKKFFEEKTRVVSTKTPQRRVSARHFVLGRAPYRRTEIEGRGTKRVFLVIDCSGSMGGFHIQEGRLLVLALSMLARQGYIEGHVALSGKNGGATWELFKLPMAEQIISRISNIGGGEGLEYTMKDHLKLLQQADFTFVYTDGQITDKPIDKAFFHRHGVYTWGLYAGNTQEFMEELMKYFDKALMRNSVEALVDAMLVQQK